MDLSRNYVRSDSDSPDFASNHATTATTLDDLFASHGQVSFFLASFLFFINEILLHILGFKISRNWFFVGMYNNCRMGKWIWV